MQTFSKMSLRNCGVLSCTTWWTLRRDFRYSMKRLKKPTKCSAVRMVPGTASGRDEEKGGKATSSNFLKTECLVFESKQCNEQMQNKSKNQIHFVLMSYLEEFHLVTQDLPGRRQFPWRHSPPSVPPPVACTPPSV